MTSSDQLRHLIREVLQIGDRADGLTEGSGLLGDLPELDSMAVATLIAAIEDDFEITIYDDEITAETFETFGSLVAFVEQKRAV